ncbi:MAG: DUF5024 domain-containing protein [Prevotella sp.]|nr:DUF5024 domain-containing protein [Prevotella sp.]
MIRFVRYCGLLLLCCLWLTMPVSAQNSIDKMVENYSTVGSSKYTSVVERDPDTRQVQKVVKVLQVPGHQTGQFRAAFMKEKETGTFTHQQQDDEQTLTLTCETPQQARIYMLRLSGRHTHYHSGKVTIIVKMKR